MTKPVWSCVLVSMALAAAVFLPVMRSEFVWDDRIVQRDQIPQFKSIGDVFFPPEAVPVWPTGRYYRPVVMLSYLAEDALNVTILGAPPDADGRLDPDRARIPHAATLLMHLLATGAVVLLAARLLQREGGDWIAGMWAAGLVFALHPIHSESVSFVAGRSDILATLFLVSSLLCVLAADGRPMTGVSRRWMPAASGALFLLALLSKEVAAAGIVLAPLCLGLKGFGGGEEHFPSRHRRWMLPYLLAVGVYLSLRAGAGGFTLPEPYGSALSPLRFLQASAFYAGKIVIPWPITPFVPAMPGAAATAFGLMILAMSGAAAVFALRKGRKLFAVCWLWFAVTVAPSLTISAWGFGLAPAAERYLYLPSVGFALALGGITALLQRDTGRRRLFVLACGAFLAVYALTSWNAAGVWRDDVSLLTMISKQKIATGNPYPWAQLGHVYKRLGRLEEAADAYHKVLGEGVLQLDRYRGQAYKGLGDIAIIGFEEAAQKDLMLESIARLREAEGNYERAAEITPKEAEYWKLLAMARFQRVIMEREGSGVETPGLLEGAGQALDEAVRLDPSDPETLLLVRIRRNIVPGSRDRGGQR